MKQIIYLAGNITDDVRTFQWRDEFEKIMNDYVNEGFIEIENPANTEFDKQLRSGKIKADLGNIRKQDFGNEMMRNKVKSSQFLFRAKDYQIIKNSNLIVANLHIIDEKRPIIGTIQEFVWAHDIFYLPIIGIMGDYSNIYCNHPWMLECLSAKVETVRDAADLVLDFFV